MPVHNDIAALLSGTFINYFHCQKIIEILKETEADTKNLFGRYGSKRMKDWLDVVKNYERDNLYLAEAAQMLARNISYEIPGLKKQIAKEEQMHLVCIKISCQYFMFLFIFNVERKIKYVLRKFKNMCYKSF